MSPSRPEPSRKHTVLMVKGKPKSNRGERGDRAREVDDSTTAFHPLVGETFARKHTSVHSDPSNSFEGSAEGSSGVGHGPAPAQDDISEELSLVGPTNREIITSIRRSEQNDAVFPADQTNNIEGSGVEDGHNQDASDKDGDEDDSSGVEEPRGSDGDHESSGELPSVYDNIEGYPGIGPTVDSDKNFGDSLGKSQTPESYDEDEFSTSDEEDIGSDEEEDSYEEHYPDVDDVSSGSDKEEMVSDEDMASGEEESSGEGSGQS